MSAARRVALVTGAAQGLGRAIALRLAKDGHHVGLNDLPSKRQSLEDVADLAEKNGVRAAVFAGDMSRESDVQSTVDGAADALGGLHVMVANAGILAPAPFLEESLDSFNRVLTVNTSSVFLCYQHAGRRMIAEGHHEGRIIGASSYVGKRPAPWLNSYGASKFAIRGLTQCAAQALGSHGITVNAYAPGLTETSMAIQEGMATAGNTLEGWAKAFPMGRYGVPEDVAAVVSFLASKDASFITGQTISVDGGAAMD
ncbi:NAD(P)-binding protein [Schizophyllum commune H4-8]|nr:NAD(P)-binding protein [Schizophyllum commune H4-8]KAI5886358.1 NAD(P)-binding protein [Schizophyllum commune H4-8]